MDRRVGQWGRERPASSPVKQSLRRGPFHPAEKDRVRRPVWCGASARRPFRQPSREVYRADTRAQTLLSGCRPDRAGCAHRGAGQRHSLRRDPDDLGSEDHAGSGGGIARPHSGSCAGDPPGGTDRSGHESRSRGARRAGSRSGFCGAGCDNAGCRVACNRPCRVTHRDTGNGDGQIAGCAATRRDAPERGEYPVRDRLQGRRAGHARRSRDENSGQGRCQRYERRRDQRCRDRGQREHYRRGEGGNQLRDGRQPGGGHACSRLEQYGCCGSRIRAGSVQSDGYAAELPVATGAATEIIRARREERPGLLTRQAVSPPRSLHPAEKDRVRRPVGRDPPGAAAYPSRGY